MGNICFGDDATQSDSNASTLTVKSNSTENSTKTDKNKQQPPDFDHLFKILLIGDSSVGKTSICTRFTDNAFSEAFIATLGVDFKIKVLNIDGKKVRLQVWDTAGQERFRTITQAFYRGAHGIVVVYDITDRQSFQNVQRWLEDVERYAPDNVLKMLVGNKSDLVDQRDVVTKEAMDFAKSNNLLFMEVSAKTCSNIETLFSDIATTLTRKTVDN